MVFRFGYKVLYFVVLMSGFCLMVLYFLCFLIICVCWLWLILYFWLVFVLSVGVNVVWFICWNICCLRECYFFWILYKCFDNVVFVLMVWFGGIGYIIMRFFCWVVRILSLWLSLNWNGCFKCSFGKSNFV